VFAVQLARLAGARVIGTESATSADALRALGAEPVAYRDGLVDRLRALAPTDVTAAIDLYGTETEQAARELSVPDERITTIAAQVDGITACAIHHQRGYPHPLLVRQLRSPRAARSEQCHTGRSYPGPTSAASGWASRPASSLKSRPPPGRRSGSR
jgi:NADPH:quinone reductase-like Zn-dependent oxidoreductase